MDQIAVLIFIVLPIVIIEFVAALAEYNPTNSGLYYYSYLIMITCIQQITVLTIFRISTSFLWLLLINPSSNYHLLTVDNGDKLSSKQYHFSLYYSLLASTCSLLQCVMISKEQLLSLDYCVEGISQSTPSYSAVQC